MFKLMKLELKKRSKYTPLFIGFIIFAITLGCALLGGLLFNMNTILENLSKFMDIGAADVLEAQKEVASIQGNKIQIINALVGLCYLIYGAVNYATYIVQGSKNKELQNLFTYPISRRKIIISKILLAFILTVVGFFITKIIMLLLFTNAYADMFAIMKMMLVSLADGVSVAIISMLAMIVGVWKKSVVWAIVSGTIVALFLYGNVGNFTMGSVPLALYIISFIVFVATLIFIKRIEKADLLN